MKKSWRQGPAHRGKDSRRVLELLSANSDLTNLLANIDIPVVLLDRDMTVRRFTPSAEKVLGLTTEVIGRPVVELTLPLRLRNLKDLLRKVIKTGSVEKLEIQDHRNRWYYLFIRPYRTDKNRKDRTRAEGAVLALVDINERKLAEKSVKRLATVVLDSNDAVIVCDLKDRIIAWNKGALRMYGYTEGEALGMNISRLMPVNLLIRARDLVRVSAAPIEVQRRAKYGRILDVQLTVTVLRDDKGRPTEVATTERDITQQKRAALEMRRLNSRSISAQETERERIARDLHDGVGQMLSGVKFRLQALPGHMTLGAAAEANLVKLGGVLDRAIAEIRRVSQNLMPAELVHLGLEPALTTLCREFRERSGIPVTLRTVSAVITPDTGLALYRITQEALNNIAKHSKATMAAVVLSRKGPDLVLCVGDNGIGYEAGTGRARAGKGVGLGNMRQRAESVAGSIDVRSVRGAGTTLLVRVPVSGLRGSAL